jgi:hypothetical protein
MFNIEESLPFIRVTFSGDLDARQLYLAVDKVKALECYRDKNDLWIFQGCSASFSHSSLMGLITAIGHDYPSPAVRTKTAIVATSGLLTALAELFRQEAIDLPYAIEIFSNQSSAETWLLQQEDP